jgi:2-polyprenyl-3-methyl-5-hydroxy-6-metoxy-1,4-benzoquinol methylase
MRCPICRSEATRSLFVHDEFDIRRCAGCDHLWAAGDASGDYADHPSLLEYYLRDEQPHRALMRKSLRTLRPWLRPGARVLDFGCGPGLFVLEARAQGFDAVGIDSASWVTEAAAHWNLPLHAGSIETAPYAEASFDAVVSIVSHEHLADPAAISTRLARLLRPGGILAIVSVPHSRGIAWLLLREQWWDLAPPAHLQFFSRRSLRRLLEDCGLQVVKTRTTGVGTAFFATLLGRGRSARTALDQFQMQTNSGEAGGDAGGPVRWLASRVAVPFLNECLDATGLGNNLTMIARKPP